MKNDDYTILCELKEKLSKKITLLDMQIFGSRSRGEADEYSDFDAFIETETLNKKIKETIKDIVWKVGIENNAVISPLRYSPIVELFEYRLKQDLKELLKDIESDEIPYIRKGEELVFA